MKVAHARTLNVVPILNPRCMPCSFTDKTPILIINQNDHTLAVWDFCHLIMLSGTNWRRADESDAMPFSTHSFPTRPRHQIGMTLQETAQDAGVRI